MKHSVIIFGLILSASAANACENGRHASHSSKNSTRTVAFVSEANAAETAVSRFKVTKMSCESCQAKIESTLKKIDGVEKLTFDLKAKVMTVSYQASKVTPSQITAALTEAGFPGTVL